MLRRRSAAFRGLLLPPQASLLMLGAVAALLAGAVVLFAFGDALGAKGGTSGLPTSRRSGTAGDARPLLAPIQAAVFEPDFPNPRPLEEAEYRALAAIAAIRGGRRSGSSSTPAM
jgi:hypothetical protein